MIDSLLNCQAGGSSGRLMNATGEGKAAEGAWRQHLAVYAASVLTATPDWTDNPAIL